MKWHVSGNEQLTNKPTIDRNPVSLMWICGLAVCCCFLLSHMVNGTFWSFALLARKSISVICNFMTFHFKRRPTYHSLNGSN